MPNSRCLYRSSVTDGKHQVDFVIEILKYAGIK